MLALFLFYRLTPNDSIPTRLKKCDKPPMTNAVGYYIGIMNNELPVYAKVINTIPKKGMLEIQYVDSFSAREIVMDDEYDSLPYVAGQVDWFKED